MLTILERQVLAAVLDAAILRTANPEIVNLLIAIRRKIDFDVLVGRR